MLSALGSVFGYWREETRASGVGAGIGEMTEPI